MSVVGVSPVVTLFGWNPEELQSVAAFDLVHHRFAVRVEAAVYRIVEEALTNVMRHASARSVTISLKHGAGTLTISEGRR